MEPPSAGLGRGELTLSGHHGWSIATRRHPVGSAKTYAANGETYGPFESVSLRDLVFYSYMLRGPFRKGAFSVPIRRRRHKKFRERRYRHRAWRNPRKSATGTSRQIRRWGDLRHNAV